MNDGFTVSIVGLGLMGGSLALALRRANGVGAYGRVPLPPFHAYRIIGVARSAETLAAAQAAGAVEAATTDLAEGIAEADIIVLATPVRTILRLLPEVGRYAKPGALVLDLGSTKAQICQAMAALPEHLQAVGGHPMCGKEVSGFTAADADLFRGRPFVLCPLPRTSFAALDLARSLARAAGAQPVILDPAVHDHAVAAISHLPYAVAATLVGTVAAADDPLAWTLVSSGFRDTTRIAASDVEMMLDVLLTNREPVLGWLDAFIGQLANLHSALNAGDESALRTQLAVAQARRADLTL
jgi:prephenate dehydrogenase